MNQSQFLALFKSSLAKFKITYWDPCTGQCVIGECDGGSGGTETLTTLNSVTLLPGNILQITYTGEDGIPQVRTTSLASLAQTITTLVDNGNNTFTYTSENGTVTTIDYSSSETTTTLTNTVTGSLIGTYTNELGVAVDINQTITTISGNTYTNEAGTPTDIVQTVEATLDTNGDLIVTVNGVDSTPLDIPTIPTWKKEILNIVADNTIPNLGFLPVADSVILVYDGYTLCENLHYTISGQSITFNPANLGKDILVGELVHVQYQTII